MSHEDSEILKGAINQFTLNVAPDTENHVVNLHGAPYTRTESCRKSYV